MGIRAVRDLLESWFDHIPDGAQPDLLGRFRSRDDVQHQGAFFELFWHELLCCSNYQVQLHPPLPDVNTNPDFLAFRNGLPQFYLEATLATAPRRDRAAERRIAELHDTLDRIDSPDFYLHIEYRGSPQGNIPGRILRARLEQWLGELDFGYISRLHREGDHRVVPTFVWPGTDFSLTFTPIPKGPERRGQRGVRPVGAIMADELRELHTDEDIRAAIDGKARKYGNLRLPLVVAVNVMDDFCDQIDIWDALFGQQQIIAFRGRDGEFRHEVGRSPNGAWRGRAGARNTLVSGVIVTHQLSPTTLWNNGVDLIHNPWATSPLPCDALSLSQVTIAVRDGQITRREGTAAAGLLGIPRPWPVPDQDIR